MGLFDRLINNTYDKEFFKWLDSILKLELPNEIKAINFNLYKDINNKWSIELIGSSSFNENDPDWACDEVFTTRENPFVITKESKWNEIETLFTNLVNKYLESGKYCNKLKQYEAIGIGFVDGDLNILYKK